VQSNDGLLSGGFYATMAAAPHLENIRFPLRYLRKLESVTRSDRRGSIPRGFFRDRHVRNACITVTCPPPHLEKTFTYIIDNRRTYLELKRLPMQAASLLARKIAPSLVDSGASGLQAAMRWAYARCPHH
jgi:hypothetical protein